MLLSVWSHSSWETEWRTDLEIDSVQDSAISFFSAFPICPDNIARIAGFGLVWSEPHQQNTPCPLHCGSLLLDSASTHLS